MHTEEEQAKPLFGVESLSVLNDWEYAYVGRSWWDFFFIRKVWDEYRFKEIETLDDTTMSDRMREDFDDHEAWVSAVRNWETDESYDDWRQDIDIRDECSPWDYHDCPTEIVEILYNLDFWGDEDSDECDWYYLDDYNTWTISRTNMEMLYNKIDTNDFFNQKLWEDLEKKFWYNQVEFLAAEPIR